MYFITTLEIMPMKELKMEYMITHLMHKMSHVSDNTGSGVKILGMSNTKLEPRSSPNKRGPRARQWI